MASWAEETTEMEYSFRIDYADGTFSIERVVAIGSLYESYESVKRGLAADDTVRLVGMRDLSPQACLAF